ncbi:hypothetical protein K0M31_012642 [Melipona bicolor]|uniref:Transposase Tc1-like domain-containing protein n=1 Tax=Melipona bicolor TaxID=60889 RepID=A0AA40FJI5_9HYME|nr:hypothetical protein K0M31_012642 [Melipona bicolor]
MRQNRMILKEVHKNRNISLKQLKSELNLPIKETQIRMRIKEAGYHGRVSRKRPLIRKRNAQKRLTFAKQFSLDLNSIDHPWDHLDRNVPEHCRNDKQLFQRELLKAWSE